MDAFDPSMFPSLATFEVLGEARDDRGNIIEGWTPAGDPLPCRVRFLGPKEGISAATPVAETPVRIAFPADPGAREGDALSVGSRRFRALAPAEARDADGALFVLTCRLYT